MNIALNIFYSVINLLENIISIIHNCSDYLNNFIWLFNFSLNIELKNQIIILITVIAVSSSLIFFSGRIGKAAQIILGTLAAGTTKLVKVLKQLKILKM